MLLETGWDAAGGSDDEERRFRTTFAAEPGPWTLRFGGIATVAEVFLNGERILESDSMFVAHEVDVELRESNELELHCLALAPLLAEPRRPRARWRTRIADGNLRFFRTTLLGSVHPPAPAVA